MYDTSIAFSRMAHVWYHLTPAAEPKSRSLCTTKTTCALTQDHIILVRISCQMRAIVIRSTIDGSATDHTHR